VDSYFYGFIIPYTTKRVCKMEQRDVFEFIAVPQAYPERKDQLMLYGQLDGSWHMETLVLNKLQPTASCV
jgi:hypothetical protein